MNKVQSGTVRHGMACGAFLMIEAKDVTIRFLLYHTKGYPV